MLSGAFDTLVYWHWFALAGLFVGLEILSPGIFLIFPGLAAGIVGIALIAMPGLDWRLQLLLFAVLAVTLIFVGRRVYGRMSEAEDHGGLNRRGDRLIGQTFPLANDMTGGRGKLHVGDTEWLARLGDGGADDHPAGAKMQVTAIEGATLIVQLARSSTSSQSEK